MKLTRLLILLFLTTNHLLNNTNCIAQNIGINTSGAVPNSSSLLDIDAAPGNNKGLLIPRMALVSSTDATTITSPATSLLVYHTGSGGLPLAGYYYNSGTSGSPVWVQLLYGGSPGTAWMLTGNTGTTGGPNFLGTKDNISLRFRTNNTERFIIDSLGNVGIGINSPASKLTIASTGYNGFEDIDGNAEVHIGTQLAAPNTSGEKARLAIQPYGHTGGPFNFIARDNVSSAFLDIRYGALTEPTLFTIQHNGNIGIGTAAPDNIFHLSKSNSNGDVMAHFQNSGSGTATMSIKIGEGGPESQFMTLANLGVDNSSRIYAIAPAGSAKLAFHTGQTAYTPGSTANERMVILDNGNVGIGITSPGAKLDVGASSNALLTDVTQSILNSGILITANITNTFHNSGIFWRSLNDNSTKPKAGIWMYNENGPGSWLLFGTSNSYATGITNTALAIAPTGNVGIGTTVPGSKLVIDNGASADASLVLQNSISDGSNIRFKNSATNMFSIDQIEAPNARLRFFTENGPSGNIERMTMLETGNVGIGTTTPLSKLQVNGDLATQNGQVKRDFLTWNTSAGTNVMIHIKTNITCANIMYRFLIEGYNYGMASAINSEAVGYAYAGTGTIISNQNIDHSAGVISSQYLSSDGFVVIRLNPNGSNYYIGFSVSGWFVNPTGTAFNISGVVYHQNADL